MFGTGDDTIMAHDYGTIRFLIEQQLRLIDDLDRRGEDAREAHDLLRRLMRRDEDMRRLGTAEATRVA